jgi:hypothetical protein
VLGRDGSVVVVLSVHMESLVRGFEWNEGSGIRIPLMDVQCWVMVVVG